MSVFSLKGSKIVTLWVDLCHFMQFNEKQTLTAITEIESKKIIIVLFSVTELLLQGKNCKEMARVLEGRAECPSMKSAHKSFSWGGRSLKARRLLRRYTNNCL